MPVHRPAQKESGVVVAFTDELDSWLCRTPPDAAGFELAIPAREPHDEVLLRVLEDMSTLAWDTEELASRMRLLQEQLRHSLHLYRRRFPLRRPAVGRASPGGERLLRLLNFPVVAPDNAAGERNERSQVHEPHSR